MFLGPQHFQQHDRFLLATIAGINRGGGPFAFGLLRYEHDEAALAEGKFALRAASGIFPDGTPFRLPEDDELPDPLDIGVEVRGAEVALALPMSNQADKDIAEQRSRSSFARYVLKDQQVPDRHSLDADSDETVFTASLWTRLVLDEQDSAAFHTIPLARIVERRDDGSVLLDRHFWPCAMSIAASSPLLGFTRELQALVAQRANDIAGRLGTPDASDSAQFVAFTLLQILNRATPLLQHIAEAAADHPERLFRDLLSLSGDLATLTSETRLAGAPIEYRHRDQSASFTPLLARLRESLNWIPESTTEAIPVRHVKAGIHTATVKDRQLFDTARFVLAVKARVTPDELSRRFPRQTTISSKTRLRDLVHAQSAGIELKALVTVPSSIPTYERFVYFEMRQDSPLWKEIALSGDIALHVAGNYADLQMQIWAVRK